MKKKLLAGLTALLCCFQTLPVLTAFAEDATLGDVTQDSRIDIMDVILVNKSIFGRETLTDAQIQAADVNKNQKVDTSDSLLMMQYIVKLIEDFDGDSSKLKLSEFVTNLSESVKSESVTGRTADDAFISGQTEFYLNLFKNAVKQEEKDKNILISPYSVVQALGMTANGADGQTRSEMETVLGGGVALDDLNQYLYTQRTSQPDTENCKLRTANSIWYRDGGHLLSVEPDFLQINADYYGADAFKAPFDKTTAKDINKWCAFNTDNMITRLYDEKEPLPEYTVMTLINAVCFDAKWSLPYMEYQIHENDFTAFDGTVSQVDMMYESNTYRNSQTSYIEDENAVGFRKYYSDGKYAFVAMLPDEGISIDEYVSGLTADSVQETLTNFYTTDKKMILTTGLPQFSYDYDIGMNKMLAEMGMPTAFDENADFSKMGKTDTEKLFIGNVKHKTHIEVTAAGTRAAAVTAVEMVAGDAAPVPEETEYKSVILDRPFVYYIVDTDTNLPIFMGAVEQITK